MSKIKKRRNKAYSGADAADKKPVIHRYVAVQRSPLQEWWLEKKRPLKIGGTIVGILTFLGWIMYEAIRIIF